MGVSPYIRRLREDIGHQLLLLPAVCVLPRDDAGRVLLVRQADFGTWGTVGGSVEPDEAPQLAAVRECREETGLEVELTRLVTVVGGPVMRLTYPNGDQTAYVATIFEARVVGGDPRPDGDETLELGWYSPAELRAADTDAITRALLRAAGLLTD